MKKSFILSLAPLCCSALLHAQINQSLYLNNSGYAVTNLYSFTSNQLTVEAWIKAESFGSAINAHTIISKEESAAVSGFAFHFGDGGKLGFTIANSDAWQTVQTTGNVIPLNTWTHVAVTYNSAACLLYVNGVAQTTSGSMSGSITTNTTALSIGYSLAGNRLLPGNIDDLRLYAAVHTPSQIQEDLNQTVCSDQTSLLAHFKMNEQQSPILSTVGGYTGTLNGTWQSVAGAPELAPPATIYVNAANNGCQDGRSFATGYKNLSDAIQQAWIYSNITEIRVASGTYQPMHTPYTGAGVQISVPSNQYHCFHVPNGVAIKGGYNAATGERNTVLYPSILSGNNNFHRLVISVNDNNQTLVDGFRIISALGQFSYSSLTIENQVIGYGEGGGLVARNSEIVVNNCIFSYNRAKYGQAVFTDGATISKCVFLNNEYGYHGGAIYANAGLPSKVINCIFKSNAAVVAFAIYCESGANLTATNCTFLNHPANSTDALFYSATLNALTIKNAIILDNNISANNTNVRVANSVIKNGYANSLNNYVSPPEFLNPNDEDGPDNVFGTSDDGIRPGPLSLATNLGDLTGAPTDDITGFVRIGNPDAGAVEDPSPYKNYIFFTSGSWTFSNSWSANGAPPDPLPAGDAIYIRGTNCIMNTNYTIPAQGKMTIYDGTAKLTLQAGYTLTNYNMINGNGTIDNQGTIVNWDSTYLTPSNLNNNFNNSGNIVNNGYIYYAANFNNFNTYGGTGKIRVNYFTNQGGTISPGNSNGCMLIEPIFPFPNLNGFLRIEFDNFTTCTGHDSLRFAGPIDLSNLTLNMTINTTPVTTGSFVLLHGNNITGQFNTSPGLPPGWLLQYTSTKVSLVYPVLPVELTEFSARNNGPVNLLNLSTASEDDNYGFKIERSADGVNFTPVGFVDGHGDSRQEQHYQFTDRNPLPGMNYYRLAQIDFDGKTTYSQVCVVNIDIDEHFTIFPSLVNNRLLIQTEEAIESDLPYLIFDSAGRLTFQGRLDAGSKDFELTLPPLTSGIYILKLTGGSVTATHTFMKM